ncbi:MAG: cyclic nucleotide-binding domain-containing protein [Holophagales bacterium]|jgi:predicted acylesterase/phospholipase RssA/CRP-like cAMP-binding protein|nr:cyclic nucleotide-binding domain-containing protein [Holophagales bacterium]
MHERLAASGDGALLFHYPEYDSLPAADRAAIDALVSTVSLAAGEEVFHRGDPGDAMFVVKTGRFRVTGATPSGAEVTLGEIGPRDFAGEMAVLTGQPRSATLTAATDGELVRLPRSGFDDLARLAPEVASRLTADIGPRLKRSQLLRVWEELFGITEPAAFRELEEAIEWRQVVAGEALIRQGEASDAMYVVVTGRFRTVVKAPDGTDVAVRETGAFSTLGELGLLTQLPRSATVLALRDGEVIRLGREAFRSFALRHPEALLRVASIVAERQMNGQGPGARASAPATATGGLTFAILPVTPSAAAAVLGRTLAGDLARLGETAFLDAAAFDERHGRRGSAQTPLSGPLNLAVEVSLRELEDRTRHLLLDAGPEWNAWTERCLRRADRILLVADATASPVPGAIEERLAALKLPARTELVLLHPATTTEPAGTAEWLSCRDLADHHHVRPGNRRDEERLARRLAGRGVGLVLGGGGARGVAHIGVIRALEEAGLSVDLVGGTSMGAVVGAGYALHGSAAQLVALAETFSDPSKIYDRTLPLVSLMSGGKLLRLLRSLYGDRAIEDLWTPFFSISTNLTRARIDVDRRGPLWRAVRKSMSIPGVFPPIIDDGDVVVDGGVVDNFPVERMAGRADCGTVIGVNVAPAVDKVKPYRFGPELSGWQVLRGRFLPWARKMRAPSLVGSLLRTQEINSVMALRSGLRFVDLLVEPAVDQFRLNEYDRHVELIASGYDAAKKALGSGHLDIGR